MLIIICPLHWKFKVTFGFLFQYLGHFLNQIATGTGDSRIHTQIATLLKSTVDIWGNRKVVPSLIEINVSASFCKTTFTKFYNVCQSSHI